MVFDSNQGIPLRSPRLTNRTKQEIFSFIDSVSKTHAYEFIKQYFSIIVD